MLALDCPNCPDPPEIVNQCGNYSVNCGNCGDCGPIARTEGQAVALWEAGERRSPADTPLRKAERIVYSREMQEAIADATGTRRPTVADAVRRARGGSGPPSVPIRFGASGASGSQEAPGTPSRFDHTAARVAAMLPGARTSTPLATAPEA